jgi:hypothetical protein
MQNAIEKASRRYFSAWLKALKGHVKRAEHSNAKTVGYDSSIHSSSVPKMATSPSLHWAQWELPVAD